MYRVYNKIKKLRRTWSRVTKHNTSQAHIPLSALDPGSENSPPDCFLSPFKSCPANNKNPENPGFYYLCPGQDLNLHRIAPISTSRIRVYQFHHLGIYNSPELVQSIMHKNKEYFKKKEPRGSVFFMRQLLLSLLQPLE